MALYVRRPVLRYCLHRFLKRYVSDMARVRFAPSPTGMLHLGGLRTALYNYLFARQTGGKFILRIEDTDRTRFIPGTVEKLEEMLQWCGINPDEGPHVGGSGGPYTQSERLHLYQDSVEHMLKTGHGYRCFCSPVRLAVLRKEAARSGVTSGYDNRCRHLTQNEIDEKLAAKKPYAIRFKIDNSPDTLDDMVFGTVRSSASKYEGDFVIMKSDNYPTYHFANVVDDHYMGITHVLRGEEWQASTPKHLQLYSAFDWTPPKFGHLPLILNSDGTKLSKRQGDIHVEYFKKKGYFPEAVLNYLTTVGGGFEGDTAGSSLEDLVSKFKIEYMCTHSGRLQPEKLEVLNHVHLRKHLEGEGRPEIIQRLKDLINNNTYQRYSSSPGQDELVSDEYLGFILDWAKEHRISKVEDLTQEMFQFIWVSPATFHHGCVATKGEQLDTDSVVSEIVNKLENVEQFEESLLKEVLHCYSTERGIKFATCMKLLRQCLSDHKEGPSVPEMMCIIGKCETLKRLKFAGDKMHEDKTKERNNG